MIVVNRYGECFGKENVRKYGSEVEILLDVQSGDRAPASRGQRLKAAIIDVLPVILPTLLVVKMFPDKQTIPEIVSILLGLFVFAYFVLQAVLLTTNGQTIGKKLVNIRIVRSKDGTNGGFLTNVVLRVLVNGLIGLIPFYHLIDTLCIFAASRRCLHDRIAGTIVVQN